MARLLTILAVFVIFMVVGSIISCTSPSQQQSSLQFSSNGQRIYYTASSSSDQPITYSGSFRMMQPIACVNCHGPEGKGGRIQLMMQSFDVPNITWPELTAQDTDHPPYTKETLKRTITEGLDPAGNPLEYPMPRWQMSEKDLNDLVAFIKTLK